MSNPEHKEREVTMVGDIRWIQDGKAQSPSMSKPMSAAEAADWAGIPYSTICSMAKYGKIPAQKCGKRWLFSLRALEEWNYRRSIENLK